MYINSGDYFGIKMKTVVFKKKLSCGHLKLLSVMGPILRKQPWNILCIFLSNSSSKLAKLHDNKLDILAYVKT